MEALKPCPFCGGKAKINYTYKNSNAAVGVSCERCEAATKVVFAGVTYCAEEIATEAWNRRVKDD